MQTAKLLILKGFYGTIGFVIAVVGLALIVALVYHLIKRSSIRERKVSDILKNRDIYLQKEMFEELYYIDKYRTELEKGEWPKEMDKKFEYDNSNNSMELKVEEDGIAFIKTRGILRIKDKFRKTENLFSPKNNKKKDQDKGDTQKK